MTSHERSKHQLCLYKGPTRRDTITRPFGRVTRADATVNIARGLTFMV